MLLSNLVWSRMASAVPRNYVTKVSLDAPQTLLTGHATCATISSCAAATTAEAQAEPQPTDAPPTCGIGQNAGHLRLRKALEIARSILECKGVTPDASAFTNAVRIPGWSTHPGMRGPSLECGVHLEMRKVNSAF